MPSSASARCILPAGGCQHPEPGGGCRGAAPVPLASLFPPQGLLTFGYIALLARVGEQVAGSMRKALFISLLR